MGSKKQTGLIAAVSAVVLASQLTGFGSAAVASIKGGIDAAADAIYQNQMDSEDPERFQDVTRDDLAQAATTVEQLTHNSRFDNYVKIKSIDVSKYQGDINWTAVRNSGIQQAIIRAGYRGYGSAGTLVKDVKFAQNLSGAKNAGLQVGLYFYTQAITVAEAVEEANFVLNMLGGAKLDLPIYIDIEQVENAVGRHDAANLTRAQRTALCDAFCATIQAAGYKAGVYANKSWLTNKLDADALSQKYYIWLAHYTSQTGYTGAYQMWQFSAKGTVPGISGYSDMDVTYSRIVDYEQSELTLQPGETIRPVLYGDDITSYSTSSSSVASIDGYGNITANNPGTVDITAYSSNGTMDTIRVTVTGETVQVPEPEVPTEEPTEEQPSESVELPTENVTEPEVPGIVIVDPTEPVEEPEPTEPVTEEPTQEPTDPEPVVTPTAPLDPVEKALRYATMLFSKLGMTEVSVAGEDTEISSSNPDVVSVAEDGSVEAVGYGVAEIIAKDVNGNTKVCNVFVTNEEEIVQGDCNLDGTLDSADATAVLSFAASAGTGAEHYYLTEAHRMLFDFNGDGLINAVDASEILFVSAMSGAAVD